MIFNFKNDFNSIYLIKIFTFISIFFIMEKLKKRRVVKFTRHRKCGPENGRETTARLKGTQFKAPLQTGSEGFSHPFALLSTT